MLVELRKANIRVLLPIGIQRLPGYALLCFWRIRFIRCIFLNMKNAFLVFTLLFFVSNCQSSRDKCYENSDGIDHDFQCRTFIEIYGLSKDNESKEKYTSPLLLSCILSDQHNKKCQGKRNWDIVDIF